MGLADISAIKTRSIETALNIHSYHSAGEVLKNLANAAVEELAQQEINQSIKITKKIHLRYLGTDTALALEYAALDKLRAGFESIHQRHFGFIQPERDLMIEAVSVEATGEADNMRTATVGVEIKKVRQTNSD